MYDEQGTKLDREEAIGKLRETWYQIYKTGEKELTPIGSGDWKEDKIEDIKKEYRKRMEKDREEKGKIWKEGKKVKYTETTLKNGLEGLKEGKAAGPDKVKAEVYQKLGKSQICREVMRENFDKVIDMKEIPNSWKKTKTRMIPKKNKPQAKDLRPIAITNISYKLYMKKIGEDIEEHLEKNEIIKGNQIGFTNGGRTEYNHFVLQYIVEKAYKKDEQLIVIALDFKKAFDSINRRKMIEAMKDYMIEPSIINLIAKIYSNDSTTVTLGEIEEEMDINSGIKQGCTASTTLFKIVTFKIMNSIELRGIEYEIEGQKITTLFFADDSLAMARTLEAAKKNLRIIEEESRKYGLELNKEKSSILVYNNKENIEEIDGIKVVEHIKYLGLKIDNERDIFKSQKIDLIDRAGKAASRTYSVIKRSCNKMLIGKTYWKGEIIPSVLHGIGLMNLSGEETNKLQAIENRVYGTILGARKGTPIAAIRGEVGASLVSTRNMRARIILAHSIWNGKNEMVKEVLRKMRNEKSNPWIRRLNLYLRKIGVNFDQMVRMKKRQIVRKILKYDSIRWYDNLLTKTSLGIYRRKKREIKDERIYSNDRASELLFRARSNTIDLNTDKRHRGESEICDLCERGTEDLRHFMLECCRLEDKRDQQLMTKYWKADKEEMIGDMLFDRKETERVGKMIEEMYRKRKRVIENNERKTRNRTQS